MDETVKDLVDIQCTKCNKVTKTRRAKVDGSKLPMGWKRPNGQPICGACWSSSYVLRAYSIPIAEAVGVEKADMWKALRDAWGVSTAAANLAVQALCKSDVVRLPSMEKLPKMPAVYLYGLVPPAITGMSPGSYSALITSVERRYRKTRFDLVWRRAVSPPVYRYPVPYPIRPSDWEVKLGGGGELLLHCRLQGAWWTFRLRGGWSFERLRKQVLKLVSGDAVGVEMALIDKGRACMAKLVGWFPREEAAKPENGTISVKTCSDRFLFASMPWRTDPWVLNADHVRRWIAEHERFRARMAEDLKHEKRWSKDTRAGMLKVLGDRCDKQHQRLKDFIGTSSKLLSQFAARQRASLVELDMLDRSYFPSFPWMQFVTALSYKLDELGVALEVRNQPEEKDKEESADTQAPPQE